MQIKVMIFAEVHNTWPARAGKPGGESFSWLVLDLSTPAGDALRSMYEYRLTPDEVTKFWGKAERGTAVLGVHEVAVGNSRPYMRGRVVEAGDASGKPLKA